MAHAQARAAGTHLFQCLVQGEPMPSIRWVKDGEDIGGDNRIWFDHSEDGLVSMVIRDVSLADSGHYQCIAENSEGVAISSSHLIVKGLREQPDTPNISVQLMGVNESIPVEDQIVNSSSTASIGISHHTKSDPCQEGDARLFWNSDASEIFRFSEEVFPQPFRSVSPDNSPNGEECLTPQRDLASPPQARAVSPSNTQIPADEETAPFMPDDSGYFESSILLFDSTMETPSRQPLQTSQPSTPLQPGHQSQSSQENLQKFKNPSSLVFPDSEHSMLEATSADIDGNREHGELPMPPLLSKDSLGNTQCPHEGTLGAIQSDYLQAVNIRDPVNEMATSNPTTQTPLSSYHCTSMEGDHSMTPDRDRDKDRQQDEIESEPATTWVEHVESQEESTSDPRHEDGASSEEGDTLFHTETVYVFKDGEWREVSSTQMNWDLALRSSTPVVTNSSKSLETGSSDTTNDPVIDRLEEPQSQMSRHGDIDTTQGERAINSQTVASAPPLEDHENLLNSHGPQDTVQNPLVSSNGDSVGEETTRTPLPLANIQPVSQADAMKPSDAPNQNATEQSDEQADTGTLIFQGHSSTLTTIFSETFRSIQDSDLLGSLDLPSINVTEFREDGEGNSNTYRISGRDVTGEPAIVGDFEMSEVIRTELSDGAVQLSFSATIHIPQFLQAPCDVTVPASGNIVLTCVVRGYPDPHVTWTKDNDGSEIQASHRVFLSRQGDVHRLEIRSAGPSDSGQYICTASNSEGRVTATVTVTVEGLPSSPDDNSSSVDAGPATSLPQKSWREPFADKTSDEEETQEEVAYAELEEKEEKLDEEGAVGGALCPEETRPMSRSPQESQTLRYAKLIGMAAAFSLVVFGAKKAFEAIRK